ncbi:MAG: NADH-quinone oxidoreductase subunit C [Actinobacteria bacterium]|nr:NADH-quinone oxidoreductase subunit C [Actinomycetota bacterium]NBY16040.1 NADH-quinone oxidoreductase subunit C [Actinomycetota bacterium]
MSSFTEEIRREVRGADIWIWLSPENWLAGASTLNSQGFKRAEWLTATHLDQSQFLVVLCVANETSTEKYFLLTEVKSEIASLSSIYPNLDFHEREVRQLLGLSFSGLTNNTPAINFEFSGYPLRRDFALQPRVTQEWPGQVDPEKTTKRRLPPGVNQDWVS